MRLTGQTGVLWRWLTCSWDSVPWRSACCCLKWLGAGVWGPRGWGRRKDKLVPHRLGGNPANGGVLALGDTNQGLLRWAKWWCQVLWVTVHSYTVSQPCGESRSEGFQIHNIGPSVLCWAWFMVLHYCVQGSLDGSLMSNMLQNHFTPEWVGFASVHQGKDDEFLLGRSGI